jgi:hypothetical protein
MRLQEIREGKAKLKTGRDWRRALKFETVTPRLAIANETAAALYLDGKTSV